MPRPIQTMVSQYMEDLRPFMENETAHTWIIPMKLETLSVIHMRIYRMWYSQHWASFLNPIIFSSLYNGCLQPPSAGCNGLDQACNNRQHVQCASIPNVIPIKIEAYHGTTNHSMEGLDLINPDIQAFKHNAVRWVYIPLAVYWDHPAEQGDTPTYNLCMLVVDNVKMEYDIFDPTGDKTINIRDIRQPQHSLRLPFHTVLHCNRCKSLLSNYTPVQQRRGLQWGVGTPLECTALVFLTMACCQRYQFGNPWDIAGSILANGLNTDNPRVNWLHCIFKCTSWKEVSIVVGLLKKQRDITDTIHTSQCGVLLDGDCTKPCTNIVCCQAGQTYHHTYCPHHRFALSLRMFYSPTSFDIWRYMSDDVWDIKTDALPVGLHDGRCMDVENRCSVRINRNVSPYQRSHRDNSSSSSKRQCVTIPPR